MGWRVVNRVGDASLQEPIEGLGQHGSNEGREVSGVLNAMVAEGDQVPFSVLWRRVVQRAQIMTKQRVRRGVLLQIRGQGRPPPVDRALESRQLVELGLGQAAREIGLTQNRGALATQGLYWTRPWYEFPVSGFAKVKPSNLNRSRCSASTGFCHPA